MRSVALAITVLTGFPPVVFGAQNQDATVRVQVRAAEKPVENAEVVVAGTTHRTDAAGVATIITVRGPVEITLLKSSFAPVTTSVHATGGATQDVIVELEAQPTVNYFTATGMDSRIAWVLPVSLTVAVCEMVTA